MKRSFNVAFEYNPEEEKDDTIDFSKYADIEPSIAAFKEQTGQVKRATQKTGLESYGFRDELHLYALIKQGLSDWVRWILELRIEYYLLKTKEADRFTALGYRYASETGDTFKISANKFMPWYRQLEEEDRVDMSAHIKSLFEVVEE